MNRKAAIISISGLSLTKAEKDIIKNERPWGIILFKRNIKSLKQITSLVDSIKKLSKIKNFQYLSMKKVEECQDFLI